MITRYTRKEMAEVWSLESKFQSMLDVEIAVAEVQAQLGIIPKVAAKDIKAKSKFNVQRIEKIEQTTRHDVIAFVTNVAESVGKNGRFIHFGLTSSDVLDTALSLQIKKASKVLLKSISRFEKALLTQIRRHKSTLCTGRTHGMHAEPTTFGMKLCGILSELRRNKVRFNQAVDQIQICKLSGAVGTYSALSPQVERKVGQKLKLKPETIATQVIPRDRHAELMHVMCLLGAGVERLSVELRHLQRTEVGEVSEGFSKGQKGSSAMPHKKNPISSENLTGAARMLRSFVAASYENIALWHERDISHSSVERVFLPDAFMLCDYAIDRMAGVVENLVVDKKRMLKNMDISQGQLFSSHVLLELVNQGYSREEAYKHVQRVSHSLIEGENLKGKLLTDKLLKKHLNHKKINDIFSGKTHIKNIEKHIGAFLIKKG